MKALYPTEHIVEKFETYDERRPDDKYSLHIKEFDDVMNVASKCTLVHINSFLYSSFL